MHRAIAQFDVNLESAKQLGVIHQAFVNKLTEAIPLDELLRAEIVLAVSALDCYVHDVVRIRMTDILARTSGAPNAFSNFPVSLAFVKAAFRATSAADQAVLFEQEVRRILGYKTWQKAAAISEALSLIGVSGIWHKISTAVGKSSADIQRQLDLIIDRRNGIAHEGDIDPSAGFALKYAIDFPTVQSTVVFLETVVREIHSVVVSETT